MNPKFGDDAQLTEISLLDRFLGDSANRFFSEKRSLNGRMLEQQNQLKLKLALAESFHERHFKGFVLSQF